MAFNITHSNLNLLAQKWLLRSPSANGAHCKIAFTEVGALFGGEIADAWGCNYDYDFSVVVESKVSRSDFLADKKKPHRNGEVLGMGTFRYFICPEGMISPDELPEKWGLLWVNSRGHIKIKAGHLLGKSCYSHNGSADWEHDVNHTAERKMMAHLLNRVGDAEKAKEKMRELYRELNAAQAEAQKLRNEKKEKLWSNWSEQVVEGLDSLKVAEQ
ncbi:adenylosuccinate synthase [Marinomonas transparens]|uniref:Adenylosuccinate synthase n=1 Tax=Marinomonas transparens TaxID=2795388 RepID=A0A934N3N5_9GAMM|nr:adenylosuccinate synthase [Marinomonas transparens]MBJ7539872.1 adenylosuccinate synthase [Marinomonas transparens]